MKMQKITALVAALLAFLAAGGCASQAPKPVVVHQPIQRVNANLVMPTQLMMELAEANGQMADGGWERDRHDPLIYPNAGIPDYQPFNDAEQWSYERLRTSNGRSREYSSYKTRVYVRRP